MCLHHGVVFSDSYQQFCHWLPEVSVTVCIVALLVQQSAACASFCYVLQLGLVFCKPTESIAFFVSSSSQTPSISTGLPYAA
jgi:hypothetical protein